MKTRIVILLVTALLILWHPNVYGQTGLNKSKEELLAFIGRPAFASHYSKQQVKDKIISCYSADSSERTEYYLNSFNRCNRETTGEKEGLNNRDNVMKFLLGYLKALNFKASPDADNKFINDGERMVAFVEEKDGWVNINFQKI